MKVKSPLTLSNLDNLEDLVRYVSQSIGDLTQVVNGHISLTDNCETSLVSATFTAANSTISVDHSLGRMPKGYLVAGLTTAIQIFDGNQSNTENVIYLQSSGAGVAQLLVF